MLHAVGKAYQLQQLLAPLTQPAAMLLAVHAWQKDILKGRGIGNEEEALKDKADETVAKGAGSSVVQGGDVMALQMIAALACLFEQAHDVEQGGLAGA